MEEEVGISVKPEELELLNSIRVKDRFVDTYAVLKNINEVDLKLQETEVVAAKFVGFQELDQIWQDKNLVPRERFLHYRQVLKEFVEKHKKK